MTKIFFLFTALLIALSMFKANAQQSINDLNVKRLKLPSETASSAVLIDGTGQVKGSSAVSSTELGHLDGVTSSIQPQLDGTVKTTGNQNISDTKTFTGKIVASSTSNGSQPCPVMTEAQRDLISSPANGDCVYNSTAGTINIYSTADLAWNEVSGSGGGDPGILTNGSFERGVVGWTLTSGSTAISTTDKVDLRQSLTITLTAQTLSFRQDSTLNASSLTGLQGLGSIYVKPSMAGVRLCARQAGTTSTTLCSQEARIGVWNLLKIPFTLSATSSGLELRTTSAVTGTVQVDKGWLGAVDLRADVDASRIAGESFFAGTTGCDWSRASTSIGPFSAVTACPGPTVTTSSMGEWQTTDSNLPRQTVNNLPAGRYKAKFILAQYMSAAAGSALAINDGSTTCEPVPGNDGSAAGIGQVVECIFTYNTSGNRTFELYAGSVSQTLIVANASTAPRKSTRFILEYFSNSSTYSSTNADTSLTDYTPAFNSGFTVGTGGYSRFSWRREGQYMILSGGITLGSSGASMGTGAFSFTIPSGNLIDVSKLAIVDGYPTVGTARLVDISANTERVAPVVINNGSTTTFFFGNGSTLSGISSTSPWTWAAGDMISIPEIKVPIQGWENSNIIIGQFNGLESCTDSYQCTDKFVARIAKSGATVNHDQENLDWINTCSNVSTGQFSCTFKTGVFTVPPVCTSNGSDFTLNQTINTFGNVSATGFTLYTLTRADAGTYADNTVSVECSKQGADYIGKTAKAVASDQNVRAIGSTNADIQSVMFGGNANCSSACTASPCIICNPVGTRITSVTRAATGNYEANGIDGTKYNCTTSGNSAGYAIGIHRRDLSTSTKAYFQFGYNTTGVDVSSAVITCMGVP